MLVVYHAGVAESAEVARYYAGRRAVPEANLCAITPASTTTIDWANYDSAVKAPIRACLERVGRARVLYIVFSYQTPYKLADDTATRALDQYVADLWDEDSTDGSLTPHPYFAAAQSQGNYYAPFLPFADFRAAPAAPHIYSVWRLDAESAALAKGLVDKALAAEAGGVSGRGCFDRSRGDLTATLDSEYLAGDWDLHKAAEFVARAGLPVVEDQHGEEFGTAPAPARCDGAILYAGWYSYNHYNDAFDWNPGAVGFHLDSLSAGDPRGGANWTANALRRGITVTSGALNEPFLEGLAHPDGVFRNLLEGANVGDAFLRNTAYLKWMILQIGDPLYRPFRGGRAPYNTTGSAGELSLALDALYLSGGASVTATLRLAAPAPAGGLRLTLGSGDTSVATTPPDLRIPAGSTVATFNITTSDVSHYTPVRIDATFDDGSISNTLTVAPNRRPDLALTRPSKGAAFVAPAEINVAADAWDSDGQIIRVDFYEGANLIGTDDAAPYHISWSNVAAGDYTLTARATDNAGATTTSSAVAIKVTAAPAPTPEPAPTPAPSPPPALLVEENSARAIALDSVLWMRDPFEVIATSNFSPDRRTRVMLFAVNVDMTAVADNSNVTAEAVDSRGAAYQLAVEYVGRVEGFDWLTQLIVRLPDGLADSDGDVWVQIKVGGAASNRALLNVRAQRSGAESAPSP